MSNFYNNVSDGDDIGPDWMNDVEDLLGSGRPLLGYDYIIWVDSAVYYCRNGRTGVVTSDSNFKDLLNTAVLALWGSGTGTGGSIKLLGGHYTMDGTVNGRPGVHIYGSGRCGEDLSPYTALGTILTATTNAVMFKYDVPDTTGYYHQGLHHMWLEGDSKLTSEPAVDINPTTYNVADVFLEDLSIVRAKYGVRISNSTAAQSIWNIFMERCFIELCTDSGLLIESSTDQKISQCRFWGNHYYQNNTATGDGAIDISGAKTRGLTFTDDTLELEQENSVFIDGSAHDICFKGMTIIDGGAVGANTHDGFHLEDVDYISILGGSVRNINTTNLRYSIYSDNSCTYCVFDGVKVTSETDPAIIQGTGAGMKTANCPGHLNRNSGLSAATASGAAINHGLLSGGTGLTPTSVTVTPIVTGLTDIFVDTVGATSFNINFAGGGNQQFYYTVEYDP